MANTPTPVSVTVQFGNLDTFCDELAARGPNIEPVVRICQQVRHAQSDTHGPLPIEHVFGTSAICGAPRTHCRSSCCT